MTQGLGRGRFANETLLRVATGLAFALPAAAAVWFGPPYFTVFIAAIVAVMAWEWSHICGAALATEGGFALLVGGLAAVAAAADGAYGWGLAAIAVAVPLVWGLARIRRRARPLWLAAGAVYIGLPAVATLWLYARPEIGRGLVLWTIAVVAAADIGAYFVGRAVGGPRLAPRISPGKTWSGAIGGWVAAAAVGVLIGILSGYRAWAVLVLAAVALAAVSQAGDLLESAIKRRFAIKDTGHILPGHGGMMDRVDGIIAALTAAALAVWAGGGDARIWL